MTYFECKFVDPYEIESRISDESFQEFLDSILSDELPEDRKIQMDRVLETLKYLPDREADFFDLYYIKHKSQNDIARIFDKSQPTVHYRLRKARRRIQFVLSLPNYTEEAIRTSLEGVLKDPEDIDIMVLMYRTTCQSEVASILGTSQGKVRHRFLRSLKRMETFPELNALTACFLSISKNLTILKEVSSKKKPAVEYYVDCS